MTRFLTVPPAVRGGIVLVAVALLVGCTAPYDPGEGFDPLGDAADAIEEFFGSLRIISVTADAEALGASTVFPDVDSVSADITHYRLELSDGPEGAAGQSRSVTADPDSGDISTPVEFTGLVPGEWTLTVTGYDADPAVDGVEVVSGSRLITITRGFVLDETVTVLPQKGSENGSWSLTIAWPKEDASDYPITAGIVTGAEYSLDGGATWVDMGDIDESDATNYQAAVSVADVAAGTIEVSYRLLSGQNAPYDVVVTGSEVWHIYSNVETAKSYTLTTADFSYGGGAGIDVSIEAPTDLSSTLFDNPAATVAAGGDVTLTAATVSPTPTNYVWRVDGVQVAAGGDVTSYELSTSAAEAGVVKSVTLAVTVGGVLYSETHRVTIEIP